MYVGLPHYQKGTHMSRFLEVLNAHHDSIRSDEVMQITRDMQERLEAEEAHLELHFPYFIDKPAPVSRQVGKIDIEVTLECSSNHVDDFVLGIKVPATSLCPCSKEISEYGAHNQRCEMEVRVRSPRARRCGSRSSSSSSSRAPARRSSPCSSGRTRSTSPKTAYDHPKFVEDIVRDLAVSLDAEDRIVWYEVKSTNYESIHNHNAYAFIERDKREGQRP